MSFEPTHEWQQVPDGVPIPGGLEIRMDLDKGGRWARLPKNSETIEALTHPKIPSNGLLVPNHVDTSIEPIDSNLLKDLEEKAHDYDYGLQIMQQYGAALFSTFRNTSNKDSALCGRIITVCLRNNGEAAQMSRQSCPDLVPSIHLEERSVLILSALATTPQGISLIKDTDVLTRMRRELAYSYSVSSELAKALEKLLRNMAIVGYEDELCGFVDSITQAYYSTGSSFLRDLAVSIVEHTGDFKYIQVYCKPQPGLLPENEERKRAVVSESRFVNTKARRTHFDEL